MFFGLTIGVAEVTLDPRLVIIILASFVFVGSWEISISVAIVANFAKVFFYYVHERLWERIGWGRVGK